MLGGPAGPGAAAAGGAGIPITQDIELRFIARDVQQVVSATQQATQSIEGLFRSVGAYTFILTEATVRVSGISDATANVMRGAALGAGVLLDVAGKLLNTWDQTQNISRQWEGSTLAIEANLRRGGDVMGEWIGQTGELRKQWDAFAAAIWQSMRIDPKQLRELAVALSQAGFVIADELTKGVSSAMGQALLLMETEQFSAAEVFQVFHAMRVDLNLTEEDMQEAIVRMIARFESIGQLGLPLAQQRRAVAELTAQYARFGVTADDVLSIIEVLATRIKESGEGMFRLSEATDTARRMFQGMEAISPQQAVTLGRLLGTPEEMRGYIGELAAGPGGQAIVQGVMGLPTFEGKDIETMFEQTAQGDAERMQFLMGLLRQEQGGFFAYQALAARALGGLGVEEGPLGEVARPLVLPQAEQWLGLRAGGLEMYRYGAAMGVPVEQIRTDMMEAMEAAGETNEQMQERTGQQVENATQVIDNRLEQLGEHLIGIRSVGQQLLDFFEGMRRTFFGAPEVQAAARYGPDVMLGRLPRPEALEALFGGLRNIGEYGAAYRLDTQGTAQAMLGAQPLELYGGARMQVQPEVAQAWMGWIADLPPRDLAVMLQRVTGRGRGTAGTWPMEIGDQRFDLPIETLVSMWFEQEQIRAGLTMDPLPAGEVPSTVLERARRLRGQVPEHVPRLPRLGGRERQIGGIIPETGIYGLEEGELVMPSALAAHEMRALTDSLEVARTRAYQATAPPSQASSAQPTATVVPTRQIERPIEVNLQLSPSQAITFRDFIREEVEVQLGTYQRRPYTAAVRRR